MGRPGQQRPASSIICSAFPPPPGAGNGKGVTDMNTPEKLSTLRRLMQERGMAAYLVVTDDFHCSE